MFKKFGWLLMPSCLIIFTLIWQILDIKDKNTLKIGIVQLVNHEALDASRNGFIEGLKESNFKCKIDYKNAGDDLSIATLIINQFICENYDLILAISTPCAQTAASLTSEIPILITPITNPEQAGLVKSNEKPETNVTGTSDLPPVSKQIDLIKNLDLPIKTVGILFSSKESNSKYQAEIAMKEAKNKGLNAKFLTFSESSEIEQVVESFIDQIDAIYTPTDNLIASNMELISKIASQRNIPIICSDVNLLSKGASYALGVDYFELGKITANQAIKILKEKQNPANMPIEYLTS